MAMMDVPLVGQGIIGGELLRREADLHVPAERLSLDSSAEHVAVIIRGLDRSIRHRLRTHDAVFRQPDSEPCFRMIEGYGGDGEMHFPCDRVHRRLGFERRTKQVVIVLQQTCSPFDGIEEPLSIALRKVDVACRERSRGIATHVLIADIGFRTGVVECPLRKRIARRMHGYHHQFVAVQLLQVLSRLSGCGTVHATETRVLNQQMCLTAITDRNRDKPVLFLDHLAACQQEGR